MRRSPFALLLILALGCQNSMKPLPEPPPSSSSAVHPSAAPSAAPPAHAAPDATLVKGSNALGYELFRAAGTGNVALSPASISMALGMTLGGARGQTASQMASVMHLGGEGADGWGRLAPTLTSRGGELAIANRLFAEKTYALEASFVEATAKTWGAPVEAVDFKTQGEAARARINGWVSERTKNRIRDLVPSGGITSDTRLALVNAIYFLADWAEPFDGSSTHDQTFTLAPGKTKNVPMMHKMEHFRSGAAEGARFVELPYKGLKLAMTVIVPDGDVAELERKLSPETVAKIDAALTEQGTGVSLPRFTIDPASSLSLGDALSALGMKDAFDRDRADFTGIAKPPAPADRLYIGRVFHKAFVKVDEKGTEAAAATAVVMARAGGAPQRPFEVTADRPFLFLIRDMETGLVLFMGRVTDPKP